MDSPTLMDNYAPEFTKKERFSLIIKELVWALPLYLVCQFWFFDWLSDYSENAHCYFYGPITGVHLVMYGIFFLMPFTFGVILFRMLGMDAIQTINLGQHPLPGKKVFTKTKYIYGIKAKLRGYIVLICISLFFIMSLWGITTANKLTSEIKPCENQLTVIDHTELLT